MQAAADGDEPVYGVNTGFGKLANQRISKEQLATLQCNLIRSHCVGVGDPLDLVVALQRAPHTVVHYLRDLANDFHTYYNAHTFIVEDEALRNARLTLISGLRQVIANGLALVGVSAPESM